MRRPQLLLSALLLVLLLASCAPVATPQTPAAPAPAPAPRAAAPQAAAPQAPAKAAWETEWDKTVEAARKEGTLVLYTTVGEFRRTMTEALKKYGIALETIIALGGIMNEKILRERRAGIYSGDVYIAGTSDPINLKQSGGLAPMEPVLILPEVKDTKAWWHGRFPWVDDGHYVAVTLTDIKAPITINTNLVKPGEVTSYKDLLNPKWKEKITLQDPTVSGGGSKWFGAILITGLLNENYMRQLAEQKMLITRDRRLQVEWLAQGKMSIAIAAQSAQLTAFKQIGAPLKSVMPSEGTYVSGTSSGLGLIDKAAHPNAAKFFVNWFLSKEGQTVISQTIGVQSGRVDAPTDFLDTESVRQPGVKYVDVETEETLIKINSYNKVAKEIFAIQ